MSHKFCTVLDGYKMAYVEENANGEGPILFWHGNPTSSYLWRNILPGVAQASGRRAIAHDMIGMGHSDKLVDSGPGVYTFVNHSLFLDAFLDDCILKDTNKKVILVIHDWGSALGLWWGYRNPEKVQGLVYMEAMVKSFTYDHFDPSVRPIFENLRTPRVGEQMCLEDNLFIEQLLPFGVMRNLTEEEMDAYRAPYLEPGESRRPTLTWPREIPLDNTTEGEDMRDIIDKYSAWWAENNIPKLLIKAHEGNLMVGELLEFARTWKNQTEVLIPGFHFMQEDSADNITDAINEWMEANNLVTPELVDGAEGGDDDRGDEDDTSGASPLMRTSLNGTVNTMALLLCLFRLFVSRN